MTWRVCCASQVGTSHAVTGALCQDSCFVEVTALVDGQSLLGMFVADGAGSASHGGIGAELAIEAAAGFVGERASGPELALDEALALALFGAVRERVCSAAEAEGLKPRDYACTFIGVLSSARATLVLQIGDGAAVVDAGDGLELAIVPMTGEYANMTHFLTEDDAMLRLQTKTYAARASRVAAFTDGIQRIALNLAANTPHEPFFAPLFAALGRASEAQEDALQAQLANFLASAAVNERTDDDKTLAMAAWVAPSPSA